MTDGFQIITSGLLDTLVCVDGGISCSASQVLAILVGDVLTLAILVALGQTEIDDVDIVTSRVSSSNQEIIGLDIPMNDPLFMDLLNASDELACDHEHSLQVKIALA